MMQGDELIIQNTREKIRWIASALEKGCGRAQCFSKFCASNSNVTPLKKEAAFMEAIKNANQKIFVCNSDKVLKAFHKSDLAPLLDNPKDFIDKYSQDMQELFSNHLALNFSFATDGNIKEISERSLNIDFEFLGSLRAFFHKHSSSHSALKKTLTNGIGKLIDSVKAYIKSGFLDTGIELRVYPLLTLLLSALEEEEHEKLFIELVELYSLIPVDKQLLIENWYGAFPKKEFAGLVDSTRYKISSKFLDKKSVINKGTDKLVTADHSNLKPFLKFMKILNCTNVRKNIISNEGFYFEAIANEQDFEEQIQVWVYNQKNGSNNFTFIDYPWILDCACKSKILEIECQLEKDKTMLNSYNNIVGMQMFGGSPEALTDALFLKLEVRRENLIEDTLNRFNNSSLNLKKTLKVEFVGEQGIDEGGVRKEYFQLITKQLFDPKFTMFVPTSDNRYLWFNRHSLECNLNFELCGIVLGLAIYNNSINLDLKFPRVVYKKLLDEELTIEDLRELDNQIYNNLKKVLEYNEKDVEHTFGLTFQIQQDYFDQIHSIDLKPGGGSIKLVAENKEEFVNLYVNWILNESIKPQFNSFYKGFQKVVSNSSIKKLFTGDELNLLICGLEVFNFAELEKAAHYEGGYSKDSEIIKQFWEIVHSFALEEKKRFLFFCTGSDRAPIKGLGTLDFVIQRHGGDSERLPTAHTCFNHFLLPEYSSKEKLLKKLLLAIDNSQGFGLI